ncbi:MAG: MFS transporter [Chloroflexi bacterium]|nr:MFS transporter [Chloroflexota bacterium]
MDPNDEGGEAQSPGALATSEASPGQRTASTRPSVAIPVQRGFLQTFSSLRNTPFLFLWLGMLAMMGSIQMQMVARGYLVYDITDSATLLGLVSAGSALPILGLSLVGGAIADRVERKRVIQITQMLNATMALLVGLAIFADKIEWYHLMAASVFQGAIWAFLMPARQALIPQLVGKEQLSNAIALNAAGMSLMTLLSPAIAGVLYAQTGPDVVYFVIAALSGLALVLTSLVPRSGGGQTGPRGAMMGDIVEGLVYIRRSPVVMVLLIIGLATTLLAMPIRFLMPVLVVSIYKLGPESLGLLLTVMGLGSLVGTLFIAWVGRWRRGMMLLAGTLASGVALLLLALLPFYAVAVVIMLLLGLGEAARRALNQALVMEEVEDQYRGRVMSVFMMNFGLMPLGVLPMGLIADAFGGQAAVGTLGVLLLIVTAVLWVTQGRVRRLQ